MMKTVQFSTVNEMNDLVLVREVEVTEEQLNLVLKHQKYSPKAPGIYEACENLQIKVIRVLN